jgi:predicted dehydrogenase
VISLIQVGLGTWGRSWAGVLGAASGVELVGVVDPTPAGRRWAREELGLPRSACMRSLEEALEQPADAVLVVSPPATHLEVAGAALAAGKHVLCEKPLAESIGEAKALVAVAAKAKLHLVVSQNYRFRRPARALQELVQGDSLGELIAIELTFRRDMREYVPLTDYRARQRHPFLFDMAIHHLDLLRAITGRDVAEAHAQGWLLPATEYSHYAAVAALLTLDGGASVVYHGSARAAGRPTSWNGEWHVLGEQGRARWTGGQTDGLTGTVTLERWGEPPRRVPQPRLPVSDRLALLESLRAAIEQGEPPETAAADNVRSLAIVLACVRSIETGKPVRIAEVLRERA